MEIITVSNQKGGVGKSTVALHLAMDMQEREKKILFLDLDPQANSTKTLKRNIEPSNITASQLFNDNIDTIAINYESMTLIYADESMADIERADPNVLLTFKQNLKNIGDIFDYCVIDTPPTLGLRMTAALVVADHVLSPIELEEYSIDGITQMLKTVFGVKQKWNADLNFLGMLPNRFNPRSLAQKETLTSLIKDYSHLLIATSIGIRSSIPEALTEGIPVWKLRKTSAREASREFRQAFDIIYDKMRGITK